MQVDSRIAIVKKVNSSLKNIKRETLAPRFYRSIYSQFIPKALYLNAAYEAGIKPTKEDYDAVYAETVKAYGNEIIKSFSWFEKHLSPDLFAFL